MIPSEKRPYLARLLPVYAVLLLFFEYTAQIFSAFPGISPWYPPVGLLVAYLIYFGPGFLPIHWVFYLISSELTWGKDFPLQVVILHSVTSGLIYTLAAMWIKSGKKQGDLFRGVRSTSTFLVCLTVAALIASLMAVTQYQAFGLLETGESMTEILSFTVGDIIGVMLVAPALLTYIFPAAEEGLLTVWRRVWGRLRPTSILLDLVIPMLVLAAVLIYELCFFGGEHIHLSFVLFAPLVYATVRQGIKGAILFSIVASLFMLTVLAMNESAYNYVLQNQLLMIALTGTGLLLGSMVEEQQAMRHNLQLAERREMLGRMAGKVAHDFNNLLTVINNHTVFALQSGAVQEDPDTRESLEAIQLAGSRAAALTTRLLSFTRFSDTPEISLAVDSTLNKMMALLKSLVGENVSLSFDGRCGDEIIRIGEGQFEQIILNLVINARDSMSDGGHIWVRSRLIRSMANDPILSDLNPAESYIELVVQDDGCGIPRDILDDIFEPFFTTKPLGKGSGLGLSSVRTLVKQANGEILVESTEGKGTSMKLYWPVATPNSDQSVHGLQVPLLDTDGGGIRILIVEDEPSVRKVLSRILTKGGYCVMEAENGEGALELLKAHHTKIDMILTDLIMPGISGIELAEKIASDYQGLRIALMSGYADDELLDRGLEHGQLSLLRKPYTPSEVLRHVRHALDQENQG